MPLATSVAQRKESIAAAMREPPSRPRGQMLRGDRGMGESLTLLILTLTLTFRGDRVMGESHNWDLGDKNEGAFH